MADAAACVDTAVGDAGSSEGQGAGIKKQGCWRYGPFPSTAWVLSALSSLGSLASSRPAFSLRRPSSPSLPQFCPANDNNNHNSNPIQIEANPEICPSHQPPAISPPPPNPDERSICPPEKISA